MKEVKREMFARKFATLINFKKTAKEYAKGFIVVAFVFALILGWQIALSAPTGTFNPQTGVTTWQ